MEKSTKILIGVGVVGVIGVLLYKKANAATSVTKTGGVSKKPTTKPSVPTNPIIDPNTGKLTPPEDSKGKADPSANPQFDMSKGIGLPSGGSGGSKGGGGSAGGANNPDSNSGKFNKVDPNKKDENWIKALQKKQKGGGDAKKGKKQTPKVDCSTNPYDPTCQKVKNCYYNPNDPECSYGEYDYTYGEDTYTYAGYDNNKYDYSYDDGYDYSGGYNYSGGYDSGGYEGGYFGGGYFYSGNYGYSYSSGGGYYGGGGGGGAFGGKGGNPSDFNEWYY